MPATLTVIVKLLVSPGASITELVQVTVWPTAVQVQPAPVLFEAKVRPVGKVSVTVNRPVVQSAAALLVTVRVYVP